MCSHGERRSFVWSREGRRTIWIGDRVVITSLASPSRCQKIYRLEDYELMARDIKPQPAMVVTEVPQPAVVEPPTPTPVAPEPMPVTPAPEQVPALW